MIRKSPVFYIKDNQVVYYPKGDEVDIRYNGDVYKSTVHGAGWIDSKLVYQSNQLTSFKPSFFQSKSFYSSYRGCLCLFFYNENKSYIYQDPLGGNAIYYYKEKGVFACSSDIGELVRVLKYKGISLYKSMGYMTELICTGAGGYIQTSYESIYVLDQHSYVEISDGIAKIESSGTDSIYFEETDFDIEDVRDEISSNAKSILDCEEITKIAHITGGFDSRLVFSALEYNNSSEIDNLYYVTYGYDGLEDTQVAKQICSTFDKTMINNEGMIVGPGRTSLYDTHGMTLQKPPLIRTRNEIIMSGGYGETLRSRYGKLFSDISSVEQITIPLIIERIYGPAVGGDKDQRIMSDEFYQIIYESIKNNLNDSMSKGLDIYAALDFMFLSIRNRYSVSQTSTNYSNVNPRVDPLYSLLGSSYALKMDLKERADNILGFELMRLFSPKTLTIPFEGRKLPETFRRKYNINVSPLDTTASTKFISAPKLRLHSEEKALKTSAKDIEYANKINAPLWQSVNRHSTQKKLLNLMNQIGKNEVSKNFDWKYLNRICKNELYSRIHLRRLYAVYDALSWYYED